MERRLDVFMLRTPKGEYRATARVASSTDGIEINMRGGGADIENAAMYLLTDGGARIIKNNRSPNDNCVIYGVAVLESGGSCVCSAGKPGYETEFLRALAVLKQSLIETSAQHVTPRDVASRAVSTRDATPSSVIPLPVTPINPLPDDTFMQEEIDEQEICSDYDDEALYSTNIEPEPDGTIVAPSTAYSEILGCDPDYEQSQLDWADDESDNDSSYIENINAGEEKTDSEHNNIVKNSGNGNNDILGHIFDYPNNNDNARYVYSDNSADMALPLMHNEDNTVQPYGANENWHGQMGMPPIKAEMPAASAQGFSTRERCDNPFQGQFAGSSWEKVSRINSGSYYYEGKMRRGDDIFIITAVPGVYTPIPPANLIGFSKYIRTHSGGFWVRTMKR